ncbi:MAG TPA: CDF family Co(II)/Ni(II) efflux transporter DmeF, partial [Myxococcota bacterium]|nr:CDF family Co(II)/Ni(II) efflux transporter DmeF [Myxococcota bacterium]
MKAAVSPCAQLHQAAPPDKRVMSANERRTAVVLVLTAITMVAEIVAGSVFGSMALLADGWHMGSHAAALGITLFAYAYARRHAEDPRYSFGTGKVNALGGFASAVLLALIAVGMVWESAQRLLSPVAIDANDALIVAFVGLVVNGLSVYLLRDDGHHHHDHGHGHEHDHHHHHHGQDSNLRGAYLHVLADAMTSVLAIGALLIAKFWQVTSVDPLVGIVGALVIIKWSVGLVRTTSRELLDADVPPAMLERVRETLASVPDTKVVDLHVWRLGPKHHAAIVSVVSDNSPEVYKRALASEA